MSTSLPMSIPGVLCLLIFLGCSESSSNVQDGPPAGSITYKRTGVAQVELTFYSPSSTDKVALGVTDSSGEFRLFTPEGESTTLAAGPYRVTAENTGEPTWAFPNKYHDVHKTPLKVEVTDGEPIDILIP